jgi:hypothetical protein
MRQNYSSEIFYTKLEFTCPENTTLGFRLQDTEVPSFRYQYQGKILVFMSCIVLYFAQQRRKIFSNAKTFVHSTALKSLSSLELTTTAV